MAISSEVLRTIDDLMRGDLQAFRDGYFNWLLYSTDLVILGVVLEGPEVIHDFKNLFRKSDAEKKASKWIKFVAAVGWLFVVLGVAGEGYFDSKVSDADTMLQRFNTSLLTDAQRESTGAERYAGDAILFAGDASDSAKRATSSALQAESLAHEARQEADSFEKDIVSAKEQAAKAESDLADARRQAADAMAALELFKSPRTLTDIPKFVSTLKQFKNSEYTFSSVFSDQESVDLLKTIDDALHLAGWNRGKPVTGGLAIHVFGDSDPYTVPPMVGNGIRISVHSTIDWSTLQYLPPAQVNAATSLRAAIIESLKPPEEDPAKVLIEKGESSAILISVGHKP